MLELALVERLEERDPAEQVLDAHGPRLALFEGERREESMAR